MQKIACDVNNCSYYNSGSCYAERVNIGGNGATVEEETCCGSFLDAREYSDLTNCAACDGKGSALVCKAEECKHNENQLCNLSNIQVSGGSANIYTETYCASFEDK